MIRLVGDLFRYLLSLYVKILLMILLIISARCIYLYRSTSGSVLASKYVDLKGGMVPSKMLSDLNLLQ